MTTVRLMSGVVLFVLVTFSGYSQQAASWSTQADGMRGKNGQRFQFVCPPNGTVSSRVWGTDVYTDDSSICTCAVHAGLINAAAGGAVTIEIRQGASSYQGSSRHGVTSQSYNAWDGSFVFVSGGNDVPTTPTNRADWSTQADSLRAHQGQTFGFTCPPGGAISSRVWGTDLYTDDSSVCSCAVHAGLISAARGGSVVIKIFPGAGSYSGSTRNGVTSNGYGAFAGSFRFVGAGNVPTAAGEKYGVTNYWQDARHPHHFMIDFAGCSVRELNEDTVDIRVTVCKPDRLVLRTTTRSGYWIEYDWIFQSNRQVIGGGYRDSGGGWGASVGGRIQ